MRCCSSAWMRSLVTGSEDRHTTWQFGFCRSAWLPTACTRCVLPSPTPPYRNSGLYALPGAFAAAVQAATANWFDGPTTNESNVYFGLICSCREPGGASDGGGEVAGGLLSGTGGASATSSPGARSRTTNFTAQARPSWASRSCSSTSSRLSRTQSIMNRLEWASVSSSPSRLTGLIGPKEGWNVGRESRPLRRWNPLVPKTAHPPPQFNGFTTLG